MWSPDGRWIAFIRSERNTPDAERGVWLIHPDGTAAHFLAPGTTPVTWSPDGSQLVVDEGGSHVSPTVLERHFAVIDVGSLEVRDVKIDCVYGAQVFFDWSPEQAMAGNSPS